MPTEQKVRSELERIANEAKDNGWPHARTAQDLNDQKKREESAKLAIQAYSTPLDYIESVQDNFPNLADLFNIETLKVAVNNFDTYRRVSRSDDVQANRKLDPLVEKDQNQRVYPLEEALKLGWKTYNAIKETGDAALIMRANHFLRLAVEVKGYRLAGEIGKEDEAITELEKSLQLYDKTLTDEATGIGAVMIYTNTAAVYIMIAELKYRTHQDSSNEENQAHGLLDKADKILGRIDGSEERENWLSNLYMNKGRLAMLDDRPRDAESEFYDALLAAEATEYDSLQASALTHYAHVLCSEGETDETREMLSQIETFLEENDFGDTSPIYMPKVEFLREKLN